MRDVRYPIGSRFQEWTRRVSQLAEVPVSLPFAVDVLCSLPFPLFSFFCLRFCFLFCFRTKVHPHGKVERKERPILSALYYERYIERQPTLSTTGWEKGLTLARNGLRGTSALGETFGWGHGLVWDLSRRLDHLLSLLGAPVIFCLMSSPACGRGRKVEGGLSPGWGVVASVHLLSFMIAIVVSSVHGISAPSVFILALNLLPRCSRPRWLC